jgi:anti-sigma factor RsiW
LRPTAAVRRSAENRRGERRRAFPVHLGQRGGRLALYFLLPAAAIVSGHFPELWRHLLLLLEPAMRAVR